MIQHPSANSTRSAPSFLRPSRLGTPLALGLMMTLGFSFLPLHVHPTSLDCPLDPIAPALRSNRAPGLETPKTNLKNADLVDTGLVLEPEAPARWVTEPSAALFVRVAVQGEIVGDEGLLTAWNWKGQAVFEHRLRVGESGDFRVTAKGRGVWTLTLDRLRAGCFVSRKVRGVGFLPDLSAARARWQTNQFILGIDAFPDRQDWKANDLGTIALSNLGERESATLEAVAGARIGMQSARLIPRTTNRSWIFDLYEAQGYRPYLQVIQPPTPPAARFQGNFKGPSYAYPREDDSYGPYYEAMAQTMGKRALFVEILNEPDNDEFWMGSADEAVRVALVATDAFRKWAPGVPLAIGGYTAFKTNVVRALAQALAGRHDFVTYHAHTGLPVIHRTRGPVEAIHSERGWKRPVLWNTEAGHAAWRLDQDRNMALTTVQKILWSWSHGERGYFIFYIRDLTGSRLGRDAGWGMLDHFFSPRFAYGAVGALFGALSGCRFMKIVHEDKDYSVCRFERPGAVVLSIMNCLDLGNKTLSSIEATDPLPSITLRTSSSSAELHDLMGNSRRQTITGRKLLVKPEIEPVYITLDSGCTVEVER